MRVRGGFVMVIITGVGDGVMGVLVGVNVAVGGIAVGDGVIGVAVVVIGVGEGVMGVTDAVGVSELIRLVNVLVTVSKGVKHMPGTSST